MTSIPKALGRIGHLPFGALLDLLLPPACSVCDELLDDPHEVICPTCRFGFDPIPVPICKRCGQAWTGQNDCPDCQKEQPPLERIRSAYAFGGTMQDAILALKMGRRRELANPLADALLQAEAPDWSWDNMDLLVPIPLHRKRLAERGFNQAALLAQHLSQGTGLPCDLGLLRRTRPTPAQSGQSDRATRRLNVQGAFSVRHPQRIAGLSICLVDDVVTTGATLSSAAKALKKVGAGQVTGLTLARTTHL